MTDYIKKIDYKFQDMETVKHLAANLIHEVDKFAGSKGGLEDSTIIVEAFLLLFANLYDDHLSTKENEYLEESVLEDFLYSIGMCVRKEHGDDEDFVCEDGCEEWYDTKHNYYLKKEYTLPWYDFYDPFERCTYGAADELDSYLTPENREAREKMKQEWEKEDQRRFESLTQREQFYEMFEDGYIGDGVRVEDLSFDDDDKFYEKYNN